MTEPIVLVKGALYDADIKEAISDYSSGFRRMPSVLGNAVQYALYQEDPSLLVHISQQIEKLPNPEGYNVTLTITSESDELNRRTAEELGRKSRIEFQDCSEKFTRFTQQIWPMFLVFKEHGKKVFDLIDRL